MDHFYQSCFKCNKKTKFIIIRKNNQKFYKCTICGRTLRAPESSGYVTITRIKYPNNKEEKF